MRKFELIPQDRQKSYYGKAIVENCGTYYLLKSYNTPVCAYDTQTGKFTRIWAGYSATTQKHICSFRTMLGLDRMGKQEWTSLEVGKDEMLLHKMDEYKKGA